MAPVTVIAAYDVTADHRRARLAALLAGVRRVLVVEQSHSQQFLGYLRAHYPLPADLRILNQPGPLPIRPAAVLAQLSQWK